MELHLRIADLPSDLQEKYIVAAAGTPNDNAGFDLYVPDECVSCEHTVIINHKVQASMWRNGKPVAYELRARSSISNTPLIMRNCVGTIDRGYRGDLIAKLYAYEPYTVERGIRLFQIVAPGLEEFTVKIVDSHEETARGSGGFGSTGK